MTPLDVALERGHEKTANVLIHLEVEASNMPDTTVLPFPPYLTIVEGRAKMTMVQI
jgi:hypothetical protein